MHKKSALNLAKHLEIMEAISTTRNTDSHDLKITPIDSYRTDETLDSSSIPSVTPQQLIAELSTKSYLHQSPDERTRTQTEALNVLLSNPLPDLDHISPLFANLTGLNILIATIRLLKNDSNEYTAAKMDNLKTVLGSVMDLGYVEFQKESSSAYNREISSLLTGSRLFNGLVEFEWNIEQYLKWLGGVIISRDNTASHELIGIIIISALKLHTNNNFICSCIYSSAFIQRLVTVANYTKPFQLKQLLSFSMNYFTSEFSDDVQIAPLAELLTQLNIPVIDLFRQTSTVNSLNMVKSLLISASRDQSIFQEQVMGLFSLWGSKLNISKSPVALQRHQTEVLFVSLSLLTKPFLQQLTATPAFLDGITNHLSSPSSRVRDFGILIGEKVAQYGSVPLNFGIESSEDWSGLSVDKMADNSLRLLFDAEGADPDVSIPDSEAPSIFSDVLSERSAKPNTQSRYQKLGFDVRSHMKDSDDEGEDSDDEDPSNKTVSKPVYIRQLLEYFKAPDGDDQYDKLDIALKTAARLILEKRKYGNEVKVHAKDLAKALVQFKDNFDFPDYHKHRTQALVVLVGTQPEIAPYIVDLFYTADISINDRLLLLTSLSLGARFVNGFTDTVDVKPMEMKKLPAAVAARFNDLNIGTKSLTGTRLTGTSGLLDLNNQSALPAGDASEDGVTAQPLNSVSSDLQQTLLSPTIAESRESEALNGPKVLRVSSSLQKQRQGQTNTTITTNHFSKVAHLFIFPLIDSWWKAGTGIMAGSFSSIIQAHYFKTLALLLYTAAPSAPKLTDMTSELLAMLLKLRSYVYIDDPQVIESACTCILVVLDTHSDEYIVQKWPREFVDLQKWLEDVWEGVIDERVKGVAAGVLYQMKKLGEKWRRSLVAY
ncbi:YALI0D22979p [Yarrowia lipolytica CLIB122]|uniref:YALI0D22979p n=2 Tax=Yarrowia lipolytica TaxID=4952 RepID=Q6C840_YARLI|nr:YALI0D22979p [Yarrowia lipolytica CLIB122]AOW04499.1 hypothetical protein YALI1_D29668g [Yarrowia lipolytica]KAJ8054043.1 telomere length regulation protein-domain-containing protein [Yarrowia lipolytica]CAG81372.1 YALI0D22979p [Yarrowia lipolytica CLIB122]|eukprot:XP_503172.1 YALI0D22979p [Yarrowia lipolytica CLIB122]